MVYSLAGIRIFDESDNRYKLSNTYDQGLQDKIELVTTGDEDSPFAVAKYNSVMKSYIPDTVDRVILPMNEKVGLKFSSSVGTSTSAACIWISQENLGQWKDHGKAYINFPGFKLIDGSKEVISGRYSLKTRRITSSNQPDQMYLDMLLYNI